jgi:acetyl esterase/lipase
MNRLWLYSFLIFAPAILAAAITSTRGKNNRENPVLTRSPAAPQLAVGKRIGVWQAPRGTAQLPIWPGVAPDLGGGPRMPEYVVTTETPEATSGRTSQSVYEVSSPTITVFPPNGKNSGAAIIVFPGGGFQGIAITIEGIEICEWIISKGVTCILSKYRVPNSNHHYDPACDCAVTPKIPLALQDAQRTIRLVRAKAKSLNVDPSKIGVMGFSAGGYLAVQTSNIFKPTYALVDVVDKISSRPDFAIVFFPGHICRSGKNVDPGLITTKQTPPTFLLQAWDDPVDPICNSTLYARALNEVGVTAEVHLFAKGGHAFGLRRKHSPDSVWPSLLENWLQQIDVVKPRGAGM